MEVIRNHPEHTHCLCSNDADAWQMPYEVQPCGAVQHQIAGKLHKDLVFLGLVCESEHVYLLRTKPNYEKRVRTDTGQSQAEMAEPPREESEVAGSA